MCKTVKDPRQRGAIRGDEGNTAFLQPLSELGDQAVPCGIGGGRPKINVKIEKNRFLIFTIILLKIVSLPPLKGASFSYAALACSIRIVDLAL